MRVSWTEQALGQLDEAIAFIAADRPEVALDWLERLLEAGESLAELSDRGRVVPEAGRKEVRELLVGPYRLVYRRDTDAVTITMVLHGRRELHADNVP
ncbi:MAG: type II toxin-antitoxin system RelE/ParE family toxin [Coriobacteriia bacterium]|nr:type II toxin-antitoxin system RelE/ParE family toxin [Coriobacteriia bacterium]